MIENYNETELLSLMLNKDEFLRYITQRYNENSCCTQLEPLIWAIHFNIPKYQRQPLLENILLQSINYIKTRYSFLPEKQILGKTYEVLGIPTVCGEPNKYFLNTYKKYKSYYPLKCIKNKKISVLSNNVICDSTGIETSQYFNKGYLTPHIVNQEILSSTPIKNKLHNFEIDLLISPIRTSIKDECILSTEIFYIKNNNLKNMKNKTQNNKYNEQVLSRPNTLDLSGVNILNTSQLIFDDAQNLNVTETKYTDNSQSEMFFISRNPRHNQMTSNISLSYENNLSNMWSEKSLKSETKDENSLKSVYFDDLKKKECKELTSETPKNVFQEEKSTDVSKKNLSEKIKTNVNPKRLKTVQITETPRIKKIKRKFKKSKSKINESRKRQECILSDISLSDSDITSNTPVTMKSSLWTNKYRNKIEQDSLKLEGDHTWAKNIKNLSTDFESSSYSTENMITNTNASLNQNLPGQDENIKYNVSNTFNMSSSMFSNDSILLPNLKSDNSLQLETIKYKFMEESQDSYNSDYNFKENDIKNNKMTESINKIEFKNISEITPEKNLSLLSVIDISLSSISTVNTHSTKSEKQSKEKITTLNFKSYFSENLR